MRPPVGKLILMPTHLVYEAKNDLLIPAAVNILIQAGMIFLVMLLSRFLAIFIPPFVFAFESAGTHIERTEVVFNDRVAQIAFDEGREGREHGRIEVVARSARSSWAKRR